MSFAEAGGENETDERKMERLKQGRKQLVGIMKRCF